MYGHYGWQAQDQSVHAAILFPMRSTGSSVRILQPVSQWSLRSPSAVSGISVIVGSKRCSGLGAATVETRGELDV